MGEQLRNALQLNILAILPHMDNEKASDLIDFLIKKGVKKEMDLRRLTVATLESHLNDMIDASDLYEEWQKCYGAGSLHHAPGPSHTSTPQTDSAKKSLTPTPLARSYAHCSNQSSPPQCKASSSRGGGPSSVGQTSNLRMSLANRLKQDKVPEYDRNSHVMPLSVKTAIENKQRASASGRCEMVSQIVDHCRQEVPNLQRAMLNPVAESLVALYPDTFQDTVLVSEHGSDSLAKQLRDKFDNVKRPDIITPIEKAAPAIKESYGCILWNPPLPEGETEDSQEDKRITLKSMHSLTPKEWEWKLIKKHMEESFHLQRKDINGALAANPDASESKRSRKRKRKDTSSRTQDEDLDDPQTTEQVEKLSVLEIRDRWPFLFSTRGMNYHFRKLTGIDFRDNLLDFVQEEASLLIEFLACKGEEFSKIKMDMVRAERNGFTSTKLPTAIQMLAKSLKDDISFLVRFVESTTTFEEVTSSVNLPDEGTPIIIAAGSNLYDSRKFYLCIDGTPLTTAPTLMDAFSMLFSAYFVLNIEYATGLTGLLNYTQRIVAKISPQKGGKSKTSAAERAAKERVVKLHNKYIEYKQRIDNLEN